VAYSENKLLGFWIGGVCIESGPIFLKFRIVKSTKFIGGFELINPGPKIRLSVFPIVTDRKV